MGNYGLSLEKIVKRADRLQQIRRKDVRFGDLIQIMTLNSVYNLLVLHDDYYLVSGGWFDKEKLSPHKIKIRGCTWGSSVIKIDTLAACGLCLEFANKLVTSTIKKIVHRKADLLN
jgi:hypothetical protein